jgi:leucyl aminopeptidase
MFTVRIAQQPIKAHQFPLSIFFVQEGTSFPPDLLAIAQEWDIDLTRMISEAYKVRKPLEIISFPILSQEGVKHIVCVELGKKKDKDGFSLEFFRRALAKTIRAAIRVQGDKFVVSLPDAILFGCSSARLVEEATLIIHMTAYHFTDYITDEQRKDTPISEVIFTGAISDTREEQEGIKKGEIIARAVNQTRHWIDLPPSFLTPPYLAEKAADIVKNHSALSITVFNEKQVIEMGMGGLAGVSRGSDVECRFVIIEYKSHMSDAPTIAFVGKGITFDSGGLSIKPAASMETMKDDMSGAAAVISVMEALAELRPSVHVIALAPLSENLPSGKALKPGDIIRFYNGKTAEVKNTDAEGRLILADALSYAVKHYTLDAIIDVATLTGACAYALGHFYTGLMSQHDELVARLQESADKTGDLVWRLPMNDDYKAAIVSSVADICNIGSPKYMAGAITASFFLQNFVEKVAWAHLDIADSSFDVPDIPYFRSGASGAGVRLLIDLAMNWKK